MPETDTSSEYMNAAQAAKYLKLSESTIRSYVKAGIIPYRQAYKGARIIFKKSILDQWVEDTTKRPDLT